jgi:hypothetical protein
VYVPSEVMLPHAPDIVLGQVTFHTGFTAFDSTVAE